MLNCRPHRNELTTKCAGVHSILPFTVPYNRCFIQEYEDPSLRPASHRIRCVICIDKTVSGYGMPPWRGHVIRHLLTSVMIEIVPFIVTEGMFIYVRVSAGQKTSNISSESSNTQTHDILAPCVPFVEGPYMSKALQFQVGCQHGQAPRPSTTLQ